MNYWDDIDNFEEKEHQRIMKFLKKSHEYKMKELKKEVELHKLKKDKVDK